MRVAARRATLANRRSSAQKPDSRFESKVFRREGTYRANVLGHERVVAVELSTRGDEDLVQVAALAHVEHGVFGNLGHEPHASGAHDATLAVVDDRRAEHDTLGLVNGLVAHSLLVATVLEPVVLQLALAGLIADGAIYRVIEEQKLLDVAARLTNVVARVREHFHPFRGRRVTRRLKLGFLRRPVGAGLCVPLEHVERHRTRARLGRDLDEAHAAIGGRGQPRMPAVVRDLDPLPPGGFDDRVARIERDGLAVELEGGHRFT